MACRSKGSPPSQSWETGEGILSLAEDFWPKATHVAKQSTSHSLMNSGRCHQGFSTGPTQAVTECATIQEFIFYFLWLPNFLQSSRPSELGIWECPLSSEESYFFILQGSVSPKARDHTRRLTLSPQLCSLVNLQF